MKRDMDFIRSLLLDIEGGKTSFETISKEEASILGADVEGALSREEADKLRYHLDLLEENGILNVQFKSSGGHVLVNGMTWRGHDFLDSVRDPKIWAMTKEGAAKVGGGTFDLIIAIAKGYLKQKAQEITGLTIDG